MKKIVLILLTVSIVNTLVAQQDKDKTPFLAKPLSGQSINRVEVKTSGGNISVERAPEGQERIEVFAWLSNKKNGADSKEAIQKIMDEFYDFSIDIGENKVTAIAKRKSIKWERKNSLSVSFKVFVNEQVATELTTSGGNISLRALSGKQQISTSGGNLLIETVKGKLNGTTSGGNILVNNSDEEISLTTSGGNIEANNCKGEIQLVTSGGSIIMKNLDGNTAATTSGGNVQATVISGELQAHTSGGNIDLQSLSGNLTTGTSGGNISVTVKEAGQFIKIKNSGGHTQLQLPAGKGYDLDLAADKIKTENLNNFSGKTTKEEVTGKLNGGGTKIDVESRGGEISFSLK